MREIISEKELQKKERRQVIDLAAFILVAGIGFEPMTFRL
jgi:hypothetical protein